MYRYYFYSLPNATIYVKTKILILDLGKLPDVYQAKSKEKFICELRESQLKPYKQPRWKSTLEAPKHNLVVTKTPTQVFWYRNL